MELIRYEPYDRDQGSEGRAGETRAKGPDEPLREVCSPSGGGATLKWASCGVDVALCDSCGNLVNVTDSQKDGACIYCYHCRFPVIVNNRFRSLLGLKYLGEFTFEEVVETQVKLVGKARYKSHKASELAALETELRANSSRLAGPNASPDVGGKRKRRQKRLSASGGSEETPGSDASSRYIRAKWELMYLRQATFEDTATVHLRPEDVRHVREKLQFLKLLYAKDAAWPEFWEVRQDSHENVGSICESIEGFLGETEAFVTAREEASSMRDVLSFAREDAKALDAVGSQETGAPRTQALESLVERHCGSRSAKLLKMAAKCAEVKIHVQREANKIIDCLRTDDMLSDARAQAEEIRAKLFPSQAFALWCSLHRVMNIAG